METAKQVTLVLADLWMSRMKIYGVIEGPARISKVIWRLWSALEEDRECRWIRRHYLWVRIDIARLGYNISFTCRFDLQGIIRVQIINIVVATTRWNGTCDMLTSAKLSVGYLVVGITRELDKEPSLHCYPIYISYRWSMLQQCVYLMSTPQWLCKTVHPALTSMCPTCGSNVVYMLPNIIV